MMFRIDESMVEYDCENRIIVDIKNGHFYELNDVAVTILNSLLNGKDFYDTTKLLSEVYENVERNEALEDVDRFVRQLCEIGILVLVEET